MKFASFEIDPVVAVVLVVGVCFVISRVCRMLCVLCRGWEPVETEPEEEEEGAVL